MDHTGWFRLHRQGAALTAAALPGLRYGGLDLQSKLLRSGQAARWLRGQRLRSHLL